jgi:alpha/beta superfamily hydrolase
MLLLLQYHDRQPQPGPLDLQIIDGADHFFDCKWQEVADKVIIWASNHMNPSCGGSA